MKQTYTLDAALAAIDALRAERDETREHWSEAAKQSEKRLSEMLSAQHELEAALAERDTWKKSAQGLREVAVSVRKVLASAQAERDTLRERLEANKCNKGHETLPLKLWDCPACHDETRAERDRLREDLRSVKEAEGIDARTVQDSIDHAGCGTTLAAAEALLAEAEEALDSLAEAPHLTMEYAVVRKHARTVLARIRERKS